MQQNDIRKQIKKNAGSRFQPGHVETFYEISQSQSFWLDLVSVDVGKHARPSMPEGYRFDDTSLLDFANVICHAIDYRSTYTAVHSSGVTAVAEFLASEAGFSQRQQKHIRCAGYLHDLGKLAIPNYILEKRGKLNTKEYSLMQRHTYLTYRTLEHLPQMQHINAWASYHHERLDGSGYPFRIHGNNFPLGARIMATSDIFAAITEDRPYRKGMPVEKALTVLQELVKKGKICSHSFELIVDNFSLLNDIRERTTQKTRRHYENIRKKLPER